MKNINKAVITGNLTREPNMRRTQSGLQILELGVAVNDSRKNPQTGQWEEYANFLDCVMMGERAEKIAPMLSKGQKVCIEGKLRWSQWEKDGKKNSKVEIIIDNIEFIGRKDNAQTVISQEPETDLYADSIPF